MNDVCQSVNKDRLDVIILRSNPAEKSQKRFRAENGIIEYIYKTDFMRKLDAQFTAVVDIDNVSAALFTMLFAFSSICFVFPMPFLP